MKTIKTLSRKTILNHSKFLTVEEHAVQFSKGVVIRDWPWIVTPDYTVIVPETEDGQFLCFRQERYGVDGVTLSLPAGYLENLEQPLTGAKRELKEETGYESVQWVDLGSFVVDANRGCGRANLFLAKNIQFGGRIESDDLEEQELIFLTSSELEQALNNGEFKVVGWSLAVSLALNYERIHSSSAKS